MIEAHTMDHMVVIVVVFDPRDGMLSIEISTMIYNDAQLKKEYSTATAMVTPEVVTGLDCRKSSHELQLMCMVEIMVTIEPLTMELMEVIDVCIQR
jgi:hypothetical protein